MIKDHIDNPLFGHRVKHVLRYLVVIPIIFAAAGLRIWPLGALELRIPYMTFYPTVMLISLYGGVGTISVNLLTEL